MPDAASMLICGRCWERAARGTERDLSVMACLRKSSGRQRYEEKTGVRTRDVMLRDAAAVGVTEARGRGGARCLVAAARARRAAAHGEG